MPLTPPIVAGLSSIFDRDLNTLRREVEAYPDERGLWRDVPGIGNTAGTLALHLAGNLQHFFGAVLGGTGYVRNRDAEFARRDVARSELLQEIEGARAAVKLGLAKLSDERLAGEYPETVAGVRFTTIGYLMHLVSHFAYHLGQIDCHRRVVTGNHASVGAVRPADLSPPQPAGTLTR